TPLTAMQLHLRGARQQAASIDQKVAKKVERAARIDERLGQLIEALLDVSRIATGKLRLNLEVFDLGEVVREITERLRESAAGAGCELSSEVAGPVAGRWDRL